MRILFLTPYLPDPPDFGGAARMFHLIQEVAARHEVVVLSLAGPGETPPGRLPARIVPVPVPLTAHQPPGGRKRLGQVRSLLSRRSFQHALYHHPAMQRALDRLTRDERFDLIQIEFSQMGGYRVPPGVPVVLDIHNVEYDVLRQAAARGSLPRRIFNQIEYRKFRRDEVAAWQRATACVATSAADAAVVRAAIGREVAVVPNGVDLDRFPRFPLDQADPAALVFVGAMRYRPNADAARWFVEHVFPRVRAALPTATFTIVGADPPPEVLALGTVPGVYVTGTVPDVRPWVERAGTVVVPLRAGGGTRLKILEAFAMGRPVVSTRLGAAGIDAKDGEHLLLADTPDAIAATITRLAADATLRQALADRAYALVRERYQWRAIAAELDAVYARLCTKG